jgi:hypothetical protein
MKKLVNESLFEKNKLNEDTTESFVVNKKTKVLWSMRGNSYDYWRGDKKDTIDTIIEVFSDQNHKEEAEILYKALREAGLGDKYFSIKIEVK